MQFPEYPFTPHYFDRKGLKLHYLDEGDGEAVVMLHGNPSWSYYYRRLVLGLRGQYRCIVPDHIGMGLSDKPSADRYGYRLASRVDDLEALLNRLRVTQPITLIVHDWGGMIGFAWAVRHPELIKRLVILNTAAFPKPAGKTMPWQLNLVRNTGLGALLVRYFNAFAAGATRSGMTATRMPEAIRAAYLAPYNSPANRIGTLKFVQDIPLKAGDPGYDLLLDVQSKLGQFADRPTLIQWGAKDFVFDAHFLAEFRKHLPNAQVTEYADAGHYVLEDAHERVVPAILKFMGVNG